MRVRFSFLPISQKAVLPISYNYFLTSLIYRIIKNSSLNYSSFLHDVGYRLEGSKGGFKLFTYSMLQGEQFRVTGERIVFEKGKVQWQISSPLDTFIQHLITGVFAEGQEVEIRYRESHSNSLNRFFIERVETLPRPDFKGVMRFTCLSPITVSKVSGYPNKSDVEFDEVMEEAPRPLGERERVRGDKDKLCCHYLRPWEDGFSEAIKKNLVKKYRLITGNELGQTDFEIKIDTEYMNRRSGKITKNINFKGTNIIGFMAPFEVVGSPELIEIGYEAGFGEKGSMGFGMVKEVMEQTRSFIYDDGKR